MHVNDLLKIAVESGASDLHLKVGSVPMMRVRGALVPVTEEKRLDHEDVVAMGAAIHPTAIIEAGEVYFNVVWVSEADFKQPAP